MAGLRPAYIQRPMTQSSSTPDSLHQIRYQTLRFFGGRQPLCGIGVTILDGADFDARGGQRAHRRFAARPRTADPHFHRAQADSLALLAAVSAACCAANGVPLRDPRKPSEPALDQDITLPSVIGDGDDGVVEGRLDVHDARWDDAAFPSS